MSIHAGSDADRGLNNRFFSSALTVLTGCSSRLIRLRPEVLALYSCWSARSIHNSVVDRIHCSANAPPMLTVTCRSTVGEIWAIHVKPAQWDEGVGLALWDAAREGLEEEGCTTVTVWIPLRNERALRFFDLAGFKRELTTARTTPFGAIRIEEMRLKRALP